MSVQIGNGDEERVVKVNKRYRIENRKTDDGRSTLTRVYATGDRIRVGDVDILIVEAQRRRVRLSICTARESKITWTKPDENS